MYDLGFTPDNEEDVITGTALTDNVGERRVGLWLCAQAKEVQNIGRQSREQRELFKRLSHIDVTASQGTTTNGRVVNHPGTGRLALLALDYGALLDASRLSGINFARRCFSG